MRISIRVLVDTTPKTCGRADGWTASQPADPEGLGRLKIFFFRFRFGGQGHVAHFKNLFRIYFVPLIFLRPFNGILFKLKKSEWEGGFYRPNSAG